MDIYGLTYSLYHPRGVYAVMRSKYILEQYKSYSAEQEALYTHNSEVMFFVILLQNSHVRSYKQKK